VAAVDGGDDVRVARHPAGGSGGNVGPAGHIRGAQPVEELLVVEADDDGVPGQAGTVTGFVVGAGLPADVDERISAAAGDRFGQKVAAGDGFA
jgi:hypothetical protein